MTITDNALAEVAVLTEAAEAVDAVGTAADATEGTQLPVTSVSPDGPAIRILKGNPTDTEIAALVAVLAAAASGEAPVDTTPPDNWGRPTGMHRPRASFSPYAFQNLA